MNRIDILAASPEDAPLLSDICVAAKRYWGYPEEWMCKWVSLLRLTPEYIQLHLVYQAVKDGETLGWYALISQGKVLILDHLRVRPKAIHRGVGQMLFQHALQIAAEQEQNTLGSYEKMGAGFVRYVQNDMERQLPYLEIKVPN